MFFKTKHILFIPVIFQTVLFGCIAAQENHKAEMITGKNEDIVVRAEPVSQGHTVPLKSKNTLSDKPIEISYSIDNKKMLMRTYIADKKRRMSSLRLRILKEIYDQQLKKYNITLTQEEKSKINQVWVKSSPNKESYEKYVKSLRGLYLEVYKISLSMTKDKLTPNAAYRKYTSKNKTNLSKEQWEKLFSIVSFEWLQTFAKASEHERTTFFLNDNMLLILEIKLLWEKMLIANNQNIPQTVSQWKKEIKALTIEVPDEYAVVKNQILKTLLSLFPLKHYVLNGEIQPAYEELKRQVEKENKSKQLEDKRK